MPPVHSLGPDLYRHGERSSHDWYPPSNERGAFEGAPLATSISRLLAQVPPPLGHEEADAPRQCHAADEREDPGVEARAREAYVADARHAAADAARYGATADADTTPEAARSPAPAPDDVVVDRGVPAALGHGVADADLVRDTEAVRRLMATTGAVAILAPILLQTLDHRRLVLTATADVYPSASTDRDPTGPGACAVAARCYIGTPGVGIGRPTVTDSRACERRRRHRQRRQRDHREKNLLHACNSLFGGLERRRSYVAARTRIRRASSGLLSNSGAGLTTLARVGGEA